MSIAAAFAALALIGASQQVPPPPAPSQDGGSRVEDIDVIGGRPLREAIEAFTDTVIAPPAGRNPARWPKKVCVGAANLEREAAQAIVDRVTQVALQIGLEIGEPGCDANILIVAADNGSAMATALVEYRPVVFRPHYAGATRGMLQLARFQQTAAPVRWWHVALPVVGDTGRPAVRVPGSDRGPLIPGNGRLRTEVRNELRRAFVIIDVEQVSNISFQQLTDYVAMAALAQIDPDADMSAFPTVLNVFDDPASAASMTDWDLSYLGALYGAHLTQRIPGHQARAVGNIMARDLQSDRIATD